MTLSFAEFLANPVEMSVPALLDTSVIQSGLMVGQIMKWAPVWLTPIWLMAVGLGFGALLTLLVYGVLALLSYIPGIGTLPDSPQRGVIASLILGGIVAAGLCYLYVPTGGDYHETLFLPLICIGLVVGFGFVYGAWHRTRGEWRTVLTEGAVPYLLSVVGLLALLGFAATPLVSNPMDFIHSVPAVNLVGDGTVSYQVKVPPVGDDQTVFTNAKLNYNLRNVSELTIESDKIVLLADASTPTGFSRSPFRVNPDDKLTYRRSEDRESPPVPGDSSRLHIQNQEIDEATVTFTFKNLPQVPQASAIVGITVFFFLCITALIAFRQAAPRVWALALSTASNEMAQPLFLLLVALGVFGVLFFGIFPSNTLGDDIRLLKDSGVTLIMIFGMLQAVWSAGTSVSDEIEGRTALTVLSKPVSRRSFILGKYAGIMLTVLVLFAIIAAVLLVVMSYKPIYDARETSRGLPPWQTGHEEIMTTLPVLGLYFMQTMAIGAIAVALATRLPLLANFITCFVVYLIGNLTSPLVASTEGNNELVGFVGKLIAVVVPNLNVFNVQSAVDAGNPIPPIYLAGAFNYLVCFAIAIWMLAMLLFEDRDLA
ncbi:MAG: ABC transporter permease [Pirellulales bacterium]|nr:ABC transporter permease [Pirellulales bacterium]